MISKNKLQSFLMFTFILSVSIYSLFESDSSLDLLEKHFINCEYVEVIELADNILKNPRLQKDEKSRVYILKAISEYSLQQNLNSQITFVELLHYDKDVNLDENEISPKILMLFNQLKQKIENR